MAIARTYMDRADLFVAAGLPQSMVNNIMAGRNAQSTPMDRIAKALGMARQN